MITSILNDVQVVGYLESELYEPPNAIPYTLVSFSTIFNDHPDDLIAGHDDSYCAMSPALCTGDGARWQPGDPILRFR